MLRVNHQLYSLANRMRSVRINDRCHGCFVFAVLVAVLGLAPSAESQDIVQPRAATPFVRPTQYHLLPKVSDTDPRRVPTVSELVPVLERPVDDWPVNTGPVHTGPVGPPLSSEGSRSPASEWSSLQPMQSQVVRTDRYVEPSAAPIARLRPAGIPLKYAEENEFQQTGRGSQSAIETALFRPMGSPFETAPIRSQTRSLHLPNDHEGVRTVSHTQGMHSPESPAVETDAESTDSRRIERASALVSQPSDSLTYGGSVPCESCSPGVIYENQPWVESQPAAIVSNRETRFQMDVLSWWASSTSMPLIATTSPVGTDRNVAGIPGQPGTEALFGGSVFADATPGYRIRFDRDLNGYGGIDVEWMQLGTLSESFAIASTQSAIIARPYIDWATGQPVADLIAYPNDSVGAIQSSMNSRFLTAAAHYYQVAVEENSRTQNDLLEAKFQIGPRLAVLREDFMVSGRSTDSATGNSHQATDRLSAENLFVGAELGVQLHRRFEYVDLTAGLSLAAGATRQKFRGSGRSLFSSGAGQTTGSDVGWLTDNVSVNQNRFSVIPAAEFGIGFRTRWGWKLNLGYNVMFWTNTLRVTDQVDARFTPFHAGNIAAAGTLRAPPSLRDDSYLAHGLSIGLERRW